MLTPLAAGSCSQEFSGSISAISLLASYTSLCTHFLKQVKGEIRQ